MRIGVLALQGAFERHAEVLQTLDHDVVRVRSERDLARLEGLVLPGGESSVQLALIERLGLERPLATLFASGMPVLATCAGLVLLARHVETPEQKSFGVVDVDVARNAWGRQIDSFEARADDGRLLVFIRAPRILRHGPEVAVLARFANEPVLVRQAAITCATFHPELAADSSLHAEVFAARGS
jgi:5'-phosphate synthase pdxT subunit